MDDSNDRARSTRTPPRWFAALPAIIALGAVLNLNVPFYALSPGPAEDVRGLLTISGTTTYPSSGKLMLTTVSLSSVRVSDALWGAVDPFTTLVPQRDILQDSTEREQDERNTRAMEDSKIAAAAAALGFLGIPGVRLTGEGVRVRRVVDGMPAAQLLREGDVITTLNGSPVTTTAELTAIMQKVRAGAQVRVGYTRDGAPQEVRLATSAAPDDGRAVFGIEVVTVNERVAFPFAIDIRSEGIGGPSAGLMFALGIVEQLEEGDLAGGVDVAGTGVIALDGSVGAVGGVAQKVAGASRAGADVFLVPADEVEEARAAARGIRVIGVRTLADAVEALRALKRPVSAARP